MSATALAEPEEPHAPRLALTLADFDLLRRLGDGSYSQVILTRHKSTGLEYAMKVIDKQHIIRHNAVDAVRRERHLLDRIDDAGVVKLFFTFQDALSLYLGLEHCPGGELYDQIRVKGRLDVATAKFYAAEVVMILEALRKHNIVHRDLKPENLLLSATGHIKLIDFGSAKDLQTTTSASGGGSSSSTTTDRASQELPRSSVDDVKPRRDSIDITTVPSRRGKAATRGGAPPQTSGGGGSGLRPNTRRVASLVGTADYVSPEVLENSAKVGFAADLWALGCVVYQMLTGRPPFKAASEYLTFQKIISVEYDPLPEGNTTIPPESRDLIDKLLQSDPAQRLGAADLADLKAHPFFSGVDWSTLRDSAAPEVVGIDTDSIGSAGSSFDWELASLAAALPALQARGNNPMLDLDELP